MTRVFLVSVFAGRVGWAGLFASVAILVVHAFRYDFFSDDAFIVARYARNVVEGHGWVYNIGDRVEGYTSVLWLLLTVGLSTLGVDYVIALQALSLASAVACLVLVFQIGPLLGLSHERPVAGLASVLCAVSGTFACWALGGLETCGYAAAILGVGYSLGRSDRAFPGRLALTGVLCALCVLMRPEGLLVAFAVGLALLVGSPRASLRETAVVIVPICLILGAHLLWRYSYYGFLLPNTFYAKVGMSAAQTIRGVQYVTGFIQDNGTIVLWVPPFVMVPMLHRTRVALFLSFAGVLVGLGVVFVGGDGLAMYRFMTPLVPVWALLLVRLFVDLDGQVKARLSDGRKWIPRWAVAIGAAWAVISLSTPPRGLFQYELYEYQRLYEVPRWRLAGEWLRANAAPDASIAAVPIGAVGYYSGLRLFDMVGLTDSHIAHRQVPLGTGWPGHEKHDGPYILSRRPSYLLLGNVRVLDEPLDTDDPEFVRPALAPIREREDDIFVPELTDAYEPRRVELPGRLHFHFLQRKDLLPRR